MDNSLCCGYGSNAGCLALLNATFGGPAEGRIQQGEVSACPPPARSCPSAPRCLASVRALHGRWVGFAFRRGGRGYSILKGSYPYFSSIKYPVSSILPIVA
jgi:hypothetical protein